jgi:hypothetical protein
LTTYESGHNSQSFIWKRPLINNWTSDLSLIRSAYKYDIRNAVSISNISWEYYEFMELRMDNRFSFVEYLSEPVNYPSNVVGGKGFFNLYLPDFRIFVLE